MTHDPDSTPTPTPASTPLSTPTASAGPPPPGTRGRSTRTRRLLRVGGGLLAAVGLVLLVGSLFLSRFLDPERLAGWLEPRVEAALNRDVSLGRVEVRLLPLGIRLRDLSVADPTGLAPRLAALETLEFRVRILPLLRRRVEVREIRLAGLEANLRAGVDGLTNYGDFSPAPEAGSEADPESEVDP
ncbi:MAG: AsmA family protein, partial [Longimicrobiales bacterium]|nr:AsmA family protein [Longimicrobiales bacterium]